MTTEATPNAVSVEPLPALPEPEAAPSYTYEEEGYVLLYQELADHARWLDPDFNDLTEEDADTIMNKLVAIDQELERRKVAYEQRTRQLEAQKDWIQRRHTSALQRFAAQQLLKSADIDMSHIKDTTFWQGVKRKTVNLACGAKLAFKQSAPALVVNNEEQFQGWLIDHMPNAIDLVPKVDKNMVNEAWKKDPKKVPPGCHAKPATVNFHLQF